MSDQTKGGDANCHDQRGPRICNDAPVSQDAGAQCRKKLLEDFRERFFVRHDHAYSGVVIFEWLRDVSPPCPLEAERDRLRATLEAPEDDAPEESIWERLAVGEQTPEDILDLRGMEADRDRLEYIVGAIRCVVGKEGTEDSVLQAVQAMRVERDRLRAALRETRRKAIRECAEIANEHNCIGRQGDATDIANKISALEEK